MSKARNIADLLEADGDVKSDNLDNATSTVDGATDTNITSVADNDLLAYDSTSSKWINQSASEAGITSTIDGATDTNITSVADNDLLAYDSASSKWINQSASEAGIVSEVVGDTTPQLGGTLDTNGNPINDTNGVDLQHNGSTKLATTSSGVSVTGDMTLSSSGAVNSELRSDFAGLQVGTTSNHYLAFRTNNTERARINSSGGMSVTGTLTATSFSGSGAGLTGVPTGDFYFDSSSNIFSTSSSGFDPYSNIGASNNSYKTFYVPAGGMAVVSGSTDMYLSARNNTNLRLNGNSFSGNPATWVPDGPAVVVVNTGSSSQYFTVGLASAGRICCGSVGLS